VTDGVTGAPPQPGWYDDDRGVVRWWDGAQWDDPPQDPYASAYGDPYAMSYGDPYGSPYGAPPAYYPYGPYGAYGAPARTDGRTMAMLSHLGVLVGGLLVPLVIYLTVGKTDPFVRHHATEALNFSLTYLLFMFAAMVIGMVTLFFAFIVLFPLMFVVAIAHVAFGIIGATKANKGEWWRYPINIRFVSGAL